MTSVSLEEFDRNVRATNEAHEEGPVVVIGTANPRYVVLSFEHYRQLRTKSKSLAEALSMPADTPGEVLDYEFPRAFFGLSRSAPDIF